MVQKKEEPITFQNLKRLFITHCPNLKIFKIEAPELKYSDLTGCPSIDFQQLEFFCENLKKIEVDAKCECGDKDIFFIKLFCPTAVILCTSENTTVKLKQSQFNFDSICKFLRDKWTFFFVTFDFLVAKGNIQRQQLLWKKTLEFFGSGIGIPNSLCFKNVEYFDIKILERIFYCNFATSTKIRKLLFHFKLGIEFLKFDNCSGLNDKVLQSFMVHYISITTNLIIKKCHNFQNFSGRQGLIYYPFQLDHLKQLTILDCCGLNYFSVRSTSLEILIFVNCINLKFTNYPLQLPSLKFLDIAGSYFIDPEKISSVFKNSKNLMVINYFGITHIVLHSFLRFLEKENFPVAIRGIEDFNNPKISLSSTLDLSNWPNIDENGLRALHEILSQNYSVTNVRFYESINHPVTTKSGVKILMVGESGVGKTCIVRQYVSREFVENQSPTIGVDLFFKRVSNDGEELQLLIWDTAGQERLFAIEENYFKGGPGPIALVCFNICDMNSFDQINRWFASNHPHVKNALKILVGTKSDLEQHRAVPFCEAERVAKKLNAIAYFECSAKTGSGIDRIFEFAVKAGQLTWPLHQRYSIIFKEIDQKLNRNILFKNEFLEACIKGDEKKFDDCIKKGGSLLTTDNEGNTLFYLAAVNGHVKFIFKLLEVLVRQNIDCKITNHHGETIFNWAEVINKSYTIVFLTPLVEKGKAQEKRFHLFNQSGYQIPSPCFILSQTFLSQYHGNRNSIGNNSVNFLQRRELQK